MTRADILIQVRQIVAETIKTVGGLVGYLAERLGLVEVAA